MNLKTYNMNAINRNINYSFIIPHHNCPDLLLRCINSIPRRDDIEIIVVDDNSEISKKPKGLRKDIILININSELSKGAGRARNYGIKKAKGKWLLFSDSDDYYASGFIDILDRYINTNLDMVCFDVYYAYDIKLKKECWHNKYSYSIKRYITSGKKEYWLHIVKHIIQGPWNFMVKREVVLNNKVYFEEVPRGNDARFHHEISSICHKVEVCPEKLYYWIWNNKGITHNKLSKKDELESLQRMPFVIRYRINVQAWNTIPSFFQNTNNILKKHGILFCCKYMLKKLTCGVPWFLIWYHKLIIYITSDK